MLVLVLVLVPALALVLVLVLVPALALVLVLPKLQVKSLRRRLLLVLLG